ncbi:nucleotidyltransferase domain-containing protein [Salinibaculum rarum]|uniref:nucleotidyltransferase domain-containing protein n=1 Tax=Salinibaculum rarum TaxID=3058903 RepID=UPI0026604DE3|nr:nucleotidyltransferase domain-containing protein [Salinibaculum sp. KK48]
MDARDGDSLAFAAIEESLCRDPDIEFAVMFGSQTTDRVRSSSDLDIAVKFCEALSSHERFRKRCFLAGDLQQADAPFVDISDIEALPLDVAHDAVTDEFLCGDEQAFHEYKTSIETEFEERRDDIRRRQRDVIDRIAEDGLHG